MSDGKEDGQRRDDAWRRRRSESALDAKDPGHALGTPWPGPQVEEEQAPQPSMSSLDLLRQQDVDFKRWQEERGETPPEQGCAAWEAVQQLQAQQEQGVIGGYYQPYAYPQPGAQQDEQGLDEEDMDLHGQPPAATSHSQLLERQKQRLAELLAQPELYSTQEMCLHFASVEDGTKEQEALLHILTARQWEEAVQMVHTVYQQQPSVVPSVFPFGRGGEGKEGGSRSQRKARQGKIYL